MELFLALLISILVIICFFVISFAVKYFCGRYLNKKYRAEHESLSGKLGSQKEKKRRKP